jgi:hypothetical protein
MSMILVPFPGRLRPEPAGTDGYPQSNGLPNGGFISACFME